MHHLHKAQAVTMIEQLGVHLFVMLSWTGAVQLSFWREPGQQQLLA